MSLIHSILSVALSAAPWLLLGLLLAGLIKALIPESVLQRWLGGHGIGSICRAAIIGVPLPLCSCGAIPTALALHRGGAGRGPTTSFLISTPSIGIDSILLTSVLLGPLMALVRVIGAVTTAIFTGWAVSFTEASQAVTQKNSNAPATSCCNKDCGAKPDPNREENHHRPRKLSEIKAGLQYAFGDLLDDISRWMFAGLLLAGVLVTYINPQALTGLTDGILPLLLMALIGIPLYICAAAATPIAAGLMISGISPGMALVFLLAGPVTSLATLGVLRREIGSRAVWVYLSGIVFSTVLLGAVLNYTLQALMIDPAVQAGRIQELLPFWLEVICLGVLLFLSLKPLRNRLLSF